MIQHTVAVKLRHPSGSAEEATFLDGCHVLATVPGVQQFEQLRQINPKTDFTFAFSMMFEDQEAYDNYLVHAAHVEFVQNTWTPAVEKSQELDFVRR